MEIQTFEQLIEFLKSRNNDLEKAFPASIDTDLQGRPVKFMREQAACAAWEIAFRAVIQADRNRVFINTKNMKTVSANLRDLYSLMNYLDESTGCESRLSLQHLALALEALHASGDVRQYATVATQSPKDGPLPPSKFRINGKTFEVTRMQYNILSALWDAEGRKMRRDKLVGLVWVKKDVDTYTVDTAIKRVKKVLFTAKVGMDIHTKNQYFLLE